MVVVCDPLYTYEEPSRMARPRSCTTVRSSLKFGCGSRGNNKKPCKKRNEEREERKSRQKKAGRTKAVMMVTRLMVTLMLRKKAGGTQRGTTTTKNALVDGQGRGEARRLELQSNNNLQRHQSSRRNILVLVLAASITTYSTPWRFPNPHD